MTAVVVPLHGRAPRKRHCIDCGLELRHAPAHHRRCTTCFAWRSAGQYLFAARRALEALP